MEVPLDPEFILSESHRLRHLARALVRDEHLAEDLVQETWLAAIRRPPANAGALRTWLGTVLRNLAVSERRSTEARTRRETRNAPTELHPSSPGAGLEHLEVLKTVIDLVSELEEPGRSAIILHFFEGLTLRQVADRQRVSSSTVRFHVQGALDKLRLRLDRRFHGHAVWLAALAPLLAPGDLASAEVGLGSTTAPAVSASRALGGILSMSAKKVSISIAASIAILLGIIGLLGFSRERAGPGAEAGAGGIAMPGGAPAARQADAGPGGEGLETGARAIAPAAARLSISGRVISAGAGVPAARVIALPLAGWSAIAPAEAREPDLARRLSRLVALYRRAAQDAPETRSAADGGYAFSDLPEGEYRMLAAHPEHLPSVETLATVSAGAPARCDIELVPSLAIAGKVIDEAGRPVAGALVEAEPAEVAALRGRERDLKRILDWEEALAVIGTPAARTAADGAFRIGSLAPAVHALHAAHADYLPDEGLMAPAGERVTVTLKRGAVVTGRVLDPAGRPLAGAAVSLAPAPLNEVHRIFDWTGSERNEAGEAGMSVPTGADGRFRIPGVRASPHVLAVTATGAAPLFRDVETSATDVDLGDIALSAPLGIAGRVLGPDGRARAGARVWAGRLQRSAQQGNQIVAPAPEPMAETRSDAGGRFALESLPAGGVAVRAELEGLADAVAPLVEAGERDLELRLSSGITVHGRVVDAASLAPVAGAEVHLGLSRRKTAVSDERGAFAIRGLSNEETYYGSTSISVAHAAYGSHAANDFTVLGRGESSPAEIRLVPSGHEIRGRVVGEDGRPVANAQVWIESAGDETGYTSLENRTRSGPDGGFRLEEPDWLRYNTLQLKLNVAGSHPAHASGRVGPLDVPVTGEPWPPIEIVLGEGAALAGGVTDASGRPIAGARVTVRPGGGEGAKAAARNAFLGARTAYTGRDGAYSLRRLEPGPVEVTVAALGYARETMTGIVIGDDGARQDFTLESGGAIAGRVVEAGGAPLAGVEVAALPEGAARPQETEFGRRLEQRTRAGLVLARTGDDGRYELAHLPDGAYTIVARASGYEAAGAEGLRPGEAAPDIALARFSAIRGTVLAADTGRALGSFRVNLVDRAARRRNESANDWRVGSQGELTFRDAMGGFHYDGLRPGEYEVIVLADGYLAHREDVKLDPGEELSLEARLRRGARIEGVVFDADTGKPAGGVNLSCYRQPPREELEEARKRPGVRRPSFAPPSGMDDAVSGEAGEFVLDGLLEGEYAVWTMHPFFLKHTEMIQLAAGEVRRLELRLEPGGRLEGSLSGLRSGASRDGRVHASLKLERMEKGADAEPKSDAEWGVGVNEAGRFQAQSLRPGGYRLVLKRREYRQGKFTEMGPGSGHRELEPVGPEVSSTLGEVMIRAGETAYFHGKVE